ncbi:MAG: SMEK domain-containing protein [Candidatus Cryptobacteroides sp.]
MQEYNLLVMRFSLLSMMIEELGQLHLLDINTVCEYFYERLLNLLWGYNCRNINQSQMNARGVDLIDESHRIIVQVSSEHKKTKIQSSIDKAQQYAGYKFQYICISHKLGRQRKMSYNTGNLDFEPQNDLIDNQTFLSHLLAYPEKLESINRLFDDFFPCFRFIQPSFDSRLANDIDVRMLNEFFEYFSCNLMDDFLESPEKMTCQFNASWGIWQNKWHMSSTHFGDGILNKLMLSFWHDWDAVMRDNERWYYESDIPGVHIFKDWHPSHFAYNPKAREQHTILLQGVEQLKKSYRNLLDYIYANYNIDLNQLSNNYTSSFR